MDYDVLLSRLKEIEDSQISTEMLIKITSLQNFSWFLCFNQKKINEEQYKEIISKLRKITYEKFKNMPENFSDDIINKMLGFMGYGSIIIPKDIIVVDDAVFIRINTINELGAVYKTSFNISECDLKKGYKEISNHKQFEPYRNVFEMDANYLVFLKAFQNQEEETNKFICDSLNSIIEEKFINKTIEGKLICPMSDFDDKYNIHKTGLYYRFHNLKIYLNCNFWKICEDFYYKRPSTIKMIVVSSDGGFYLYEIVQTFQNDEPKWAGELKETPVWKLSEKSNDKIVSRQLS